MDIRYTRLTNSNFKMRNPEQIFYDGLKVWVWKKDRVLFIGLVNCLAFGV